MLYVYTMEEMSNFFFFLENLKTIGKYKQI